MYERNNCHKRVFKFSFYAFCKCSPFINDTFQDNIKNGSFAFSFCVAYKYYHYKYHYEYGQNVFRIIVNCLKHFNLSKN